ncbi:hypothetical protein HKD37_14G039989 [Glycine soja]
MRNYSLSHKKKSYVFSPEQNHATNSEKKVTFTLTKDESFYFIAAHWVDLHGLLYNALPSNVFLWGHLFLSFHFADDKGPVIVKAKVLETNKVVGIVGDLLVAADGCCAWRGVLEFSNVENSKTITGIRKVYPDDKGPVIVKAKVLETNKVVGIVGDLLVAADGCCAWRGVLEFSNVENSKTITGIRKVYPDDKDPVIVKAKVLETNKVVGIVGDLLVAADGCCAWRGVLEFSNVENSKTITGIIKKNACTLTWPLAHILCCMSFKTRSQSLKLSLYFDLKSIFTFKGTSVTMKVNSDVIQKMHQEAEKVWIPELVRVIKETSDLFLNFICDSDPLECFLKSRSRTCDSSLTSMILFKKMFELAEHRSGADVGEYIELHPPIRRTVVAAYHAVEVLADAEGDVAHPTTPHCFRNTNMSILDAAVLGKCIEKWVAEKLESALEEYQFIRLPVTSKQVLHARHLGREDYQELLPRNTPFFNDVPLPLALIPSSISHLIGYSIVFY